MSPRVTVPVISRIPVLGAVFTNFYPFELIILVMVAILWYIMSRTRYGMHLRACGDTPPGGRYGRYQGKQGALHGCHVFGSAFQLWGDVLCLSISSSFSDLAMTIPYILTFAVRE